MQLPPASRLRRRGSPSTVRQKVFLDVVAVGLEQHVGAAQLADLLLGALDHAMALVRLRIKDLAGPGDLEALLGARLGLQLGHLALLWRQAPRSATARRCGRAGAAPPNARNERIVPEHITAATAALIQPGDGRAGIWQT